MVDTLIGGLYFQKFERNIHSPDSDDKDDGILWRALLDQAKETSQVLQTLKEPARAFEAKTASVRRDIGRLNTEEKADILPDLCQTSKPDETPSESPSDVLRRVPEPRPKRQPANDHIVCVVLLDPASGSRRCSSDFAVPFIAPECW
jgi:hypothetical protein